MKGWEREGIWEWSKVGYRVCTGGRVGKKGRTGEGRGNREGRGGREGRRYGEWIGGGGGGSVWMASPGVT